jgi:5-methylcytosine-specific restriction endonuclease McrA
MKKCVDCGSTLTGSNCVYRGGGPRPNGPSMDITGADKNMSSNNIQILCHSCNATKWNRTHEEFINYCKMITKKFGSTE